MRAAVRHLDLDDEAAITRCFPVFSFLRPHLDEAAFLERVRAQRKEGYAIVYIEDAGEVVAAAGFRVARFLAWGKVLYVDDLVTHPARTRRGYGGALMDWLLAEAARRGCDELHLDTGYQRHDAHRLYLNKGLRLSSHHMSVTLDGGEGGSRNLPDPALG